MNTLTDTAPEAELMIASIYRRMSAPKKARIVQDAWRRARDLHAAGYRLRNPQAGAHDIIVNWLNVTLGPDTPAAMGTHKEEIRDLW